MLPEQRKRPEWRITRCYKLELRKATEVPAQVAFARSGLQRFRIVPLDEQFFNHATMNIGETEVAAGIAVGELLVVEAQQM